MRAFANDTQLAVLQVLSQQHLPTLRIIPAVEKLTEGRIRISTSAIYTVLRRMEHAGLIKGEYRNEDQDRRRGHPRRYYRITGEGQRRRDGVHALLEAGWIGA